MMRKVLYSIFFLLLSTQTFTQSPFKIVVIDEAMAQFGPEEPSIAIHPHNPKKIVAGANVARLYQSENGGKTWTQLEVTSPYGLAGDPVVIAGPKKQFFFFHLSYTNRTDPSREGWLDRMVCQTTKDYGQTWNKGTYTGLNESKDQDKQWAVYDPHSGNVYLTWTEFDKYGSKDSTCHTRARFSVTQDLGKTWSDAITISTLEGGCIDDSHTVEGVVPTVDKAGNLYTVWMLNDSIYFNMSADQGKTWLPREKPIFPISGWEFDIPGINRCNGFPSFYCSDINGQETLYLTWSDQTNGEDNTNVWFTTSTDGGKTWAKKKLIHEGNSQGHQFFPWMCIDKKTGVLYWVYYDRSRYNDNQADVVLTWSEDNGKTFHHQVISESPFTPKEDVFFGDYIQVDAHKGMVRPIWTRYENGKLSVRTALIYQKKLRKLK